MRVILMQDVLHTGQRGDVVDVKPGLARNYLIPKGLALEATPGNQQYFDQQKKKIDASHAREHEAASEMAAGINGVSLKIAKRVGESETLYGSVTATEIAHLLEAKGITVDRRRIDLEGGIKTLGEHPVRIELHPEVVAEVMVTVVPEE
ncbi:MAG: 50S ribosomal protein L9 [Thermoanaerobaculia bacterium]